MKKNFNFLSVGFFSLCLITLCALAQNAQRAGAWRTCVRVVDGDTVVLEGNETIRLIGVDTAETKDPGQPVEPFGQKAADFLARLIQGKRVWLEYDSEITDTYGRTLAYLYLEDGTFVNAKIVSSGWSEAYIKYPFRHSSLFIALEVSAKAAGLGQWSASGGSSLSAVPGNQASRADPAQSQVMVYVTDSGKKYHNYGCHYLNVSASQSSLQDAIDRGFTPCSRCRPPTIDAKGKVQGSSDIFTSNPSALTSSEKRPSKAAGVRSSSTSGSRTILTGPRGGKYYINSKGKKVYIKKKK